MSVTTQPTVQPASLAFKVPVVAGAPSVRAEFFIQAPAALGLKGDGRGFNPSPNPTQSRAFFTLDFATGQGYFQVNPSCSAGGACQSALPIGGGNNVVLYYPNSTSIGIEGSLTNSIMTHGPSINFAIDFTARASGVTFTGTRDAFPSLELTGSAGGFFTYRETSPFALIGPPLWPQRGFSGFFPTTWPW